MYYPYGDCRNSQPDIDVFPTDKLSSGQRMDEGTGLYYYGARDSEYATSLDEAGLPDRGHVLSAACGLPTD